VTTKPFDAFNKSLFRELLSPFGQVIPNMAVAGEERAIDIFFAPAPETVLDPAELGRLAAMLDKPALLEPFRSQLSEAEVCNCLLKLFLVHTESYRQAEREGRSLASDNLPRLWILAASVSERLIGAFGGQMHETWGEGFYFLPTRLRSAIVAIAELPIIPETLWLRLLGRGRTQEDAIAELLLLPERDPRRNSALSLLVSWRISMEVMEQVDSEERRILMALTQAYQEWEQQTKRQGREEGLQQGLQQGLEQGLEQGLGQGLQQGWQEAQMAIAQRLLGEGMTIEVIARVTGLSIEQIEQLPARPPEPPSAV
jgi:hypothetical protein